MFYLSQRWSATVSDTDTYLAMKSTSAQKLSLSSTHNKVLVPFSFNTHGTSNQTEVGADGRESAHLKWTRSCYDILIWTQLTH